MRLSWAWLVAAIVLSGCSSERDQVTEQLVGTWQPVLSCRKFYDRSFFGGGPRTVLETSDFYYRLRGGSCFSSVKHVQEVADGDVQLLCEENLCWNVLKRSEKR
jgi:hypothetical protein